MLKLDSWCNIINSGQEMILLFPMNSMPSWRLSEPNILSLPTLQSLNAHDMPDFWQNIGTLPQNAVGILYLHKKTNVELELSVWTVLKI